MPNSHNKKSSALRDIFSPALENEVFEENHKRRNPAVSEAERLMENNSACEERDRLRERERETGAEDGRGG